jgi:putative transposase
LPEEPKRIGVAGGTATFATMSSGEKIANPRFFRTQQKALAQAQRRLEKEEKGTPARAKKQKVVARVHERIVNKRTDFAHKQSRRLVNTYGMIVLERLDIVEMQSQHTVVFGHKLTKSRADVAWHQFAQLLSYKALDAARQFVQVDPRNTSKKCSRCGSLVPK